MDSVYAIGEFKINHIRNSLIKKETEIRLDTKQFALLMLLAKHAQQDISKQQIFDTVWPKRVVSEDVIYVAVNALRKHLGDSAKNPNYIKTISGVGYRLIADVTECPEKQRASVGRALKAKKSLFIYGAITLGIAASIASAIVLPEQESITSLPMQAKQQFRHARFIASLENPDLETSKKLIEELVLQYPSFTAGFIELAKIKFELIDTSSPMFTAQIVNLKTLLDKIFSLDNVNREAHLLRARVAFLYEKDSELAERHFNKALPLADTYKHYAQFKLALGDFERALELTFTYQDLLPETYSNEDVAWNYTMSRQFDKALKEIEKLAPFKENHFYYHVSRQAIFELTGDHDSAFSELQYVMKQSGYLPEDLRAISRAFETKGLKGAYHWLLHKDSKQLSIGQYSPPMSLARYAISSGDKKLALKLLKQAIEQRQTSSLWIAVDPKFSDLHSSSEFTSLIQSLKLPIKIN